MFCIFNKSLMTLQNVGNCKNNWDATFSLLLLLLLVYFCVVFFHFVFVAWLWYVCVCEAYWFLPKDKWNPIKMFNLHILHKKCNGKSIKNNNNNNSKLVIKSLQTFFTASENEFLVLFIFGKIKCAFILSPWQISCQKGGLVYFPNNFQIPLRNRNSSLDFDMRYCCSTERELW